MSTAYSGVHGVVKVTNAETTPVTTDVDVEGFSCDVEVGDVETTTTADAGWEDSIDGTAKVTGSFDFMINRAKMPFSTLMGLRPRSGKYPTLSLQITDDPDEVITGVARIQKLSIKSATKEAIKGTCTFTSKGAWTVPTATS